MNALEPASLADAFCTYPPEGFTSLRIPIGAGDAPAFLADFDILTSLEDDHRWITDTLARLRLGRITRLRTFISGTTVTEYSTYPAIDPDGCKLLVDRFLDAAHAAKVQLMIIKDLPHNSPLLSKRENRIADGIARACAEDGRFMLMEGQALAFVPIDFSTIDEYLARASKARRRDLRRKLRSRQELNVETVPTGAAFDDERLLRILYQQYLNVFYQDKHHFDKLSHDSLRSILIDDANDGVVFLYRLSNRLIGYNLCFKYEGKFVDKYVGFEYPLARENNLFFVSWFHNLEYALAHRLSHYVAGYNSPEVKADLGAHFTTSRHAVYVRNPLLRKMFVPLSRLVANDAGWTGSTPETRRQGA